MKLKYKYFIFLFFISRFSFSQTTPTWSDDIACIYYSHCTSCHNDNGVAPFSLIDYADAFSHAGDALAFILAKKMPPWPSDESYQKHAFANILTQEEIDKIQDWVNSGAPLGNIINSPPKPSYQNNPQSNVNSINFKIPNYTLTSNSDTWRCFPFKSNVGVETYIKSWHLNNKHSKYIHHLEIYLDTSNVCLDYDLQDTEAGYDCFIGATGSIYAKLLGTWTPGSANYLFPDSMGVKLEANSNIIVSIHYSPNAIGNIDSTEISIEVDSNYTNLREIDNYSLIDHSSNLINGPLKIYADSVKTFYAETQIKEDLTFTSILPHMHLLGKSIRVFGVLPTDTINFIDIPNWDFHWQMNYAFQKPIKIPANTYIKTIATYDNTTGNPNNPNNPPIDVMAGPTSNDEMLVIYFGKLKYRSNDENILIDTLSHLQHYNNCNDPTGVDDLEKFQMQFDLFPNPTHKTLYLNNYESDNLVITLYSQIGIKLHEYRSQEKNISIDIESLKNGYYYLSIYSTKNEYFFMKKIIKM